MTWSGGPRDPIFQRSHVERPKAPRWRGVWRIFPCLVLLCLIAGVGQAQSSDDAAGVVPQGVVVKTVLSIVPESGSSVSQGGSYESSGLSDALLWKHSFRDAVTAIDMPADGSSVAVGTTGGEVVLLDSTGNVLWTHQSGTPIAGLGITVDGSAIVAGTGNWIVLLDGSGGVLWTMDAGGRVFGADISPEGEYCVAGTAEGDALLTNSQGDLLWKVQSGSAITAVAIDPEGVFVVLGTEDGFIRLLDLWGEVLWEYDVGSTIQSISVSANRSIAAGTRGSMVLLLDSEGRGGAVWSGDCPVTGIHLGADGSRIGAGTDGGYVYLLSDAGTSLWEFGRVGGVGEADCAVTAVSLSSSADYLVAGSDNQNIYYFAFTAKMPPTTILEQDTTAPETTTPPVAILGDMQGDQGTDSIIPGDTTESVQQEAPGLSPALVLGAIAVTAFFRRIGR